MTTRTDRWTVLTALFVTVLIGLAPTPGGLSPGGQWAIATMAFAAILWITGALPLAVTALTIPVLLVVFGVFPTTAGAVAGFADPVIFLLLSGFVLARALAIHGIDRRIAYHLIHTLGTSTRSLVLAVMIATALLSMLISNTATVAMMAPVAVGIAGRTVDPGLASSDGDDGHAAREFSNAEIAILLGTAYAASIGGVGTLIGSPPNAIVVAQLDTLIGVQVTFVDWLLIGLPLVVVGIPTAWFLLTYVVYPPEHTDVEAARREADRYLRTAGPLDRDGKIVVAIFTATAGLWLLGGLEFLFEDLLSPAVFTTLFGGPGSSLFGTMGHQGALYYVVVGLAAIPALVFTDTVDWDDLVEIDWGTLLLLGGGISLANALAWTDATAWLASVLVVRLAGVPLVVVVFAVVALTILVGELASNTATVAVMAPVLIEVGGSFAPLIGTGTGTASAYLAIAAAVAASFGFALPVATPPNAIVFGTGRMTKDHMLRAGAILDLVMIVVTTAFALVAFRYLWPLFL